MKLSEMKQLKDLLESMGNVKAAHQVAQMIDRRERFLRSEHEDGLRRIADKLLADKADRDEQARKAMMAWLLLLAIADPELARAFGLGFLHPSPQQAREGLAGLVNRMREQYRQSELALGDEEDDAPKRPRPRM